MRWPRFIAVPFFGLLTVVAAPGDDGIGFFETKIRPLLADKCYSCHGPEKHKADLRLDSPDGLRTGGESGELFVAGDPSRSLLIRAVGYKEKDLQMPPKERLTERQVADLSKWIQMGAPMPKGGPVSAAPRKDFTIKPEDRAHWAFQPLKRREIKGNPVDFFILAALGKKGLAMNPPATRRELIRRATFDLTGMPPTPEEIASFERDKNPDSYEKLIDRLLSAPQYGERWGRHWLDLIATANKLNAAHLASRPGYSELQARIASYELAFQLHGSAPEALDLSKESETTKEMYGLNDPKTDHPLALGPAPFGKQCLVARRLVERGVRFIQIYHGGGHQQQNWDAHNGVEENLAIHCPEGASQFLAAPTGLWPARSVTSVGRNPVGVVVFVRSCPKVARPSQPWALRRNPVGIRRKAGGNKLRCAQLEGHDEVVVDNLMDKIKLDDYRMQTLVSEIVTSYPFMHRRIQK